MPEGADAPPEAPTGVARLGSLAWASVYVRFLAVGVLNTLFGYAIFFIYLQGMQQAARQGLLGVWFDPVFWAALTSHVTGILFNFRTIGVLVFRQPDKRLVVRFFAGYIALFCIGYAALRGVMWAGPSAEVAALLLLVPNALLSFAINRFFVFRKAQT